MTKSIRGMCSSAPLPGPSPPEIGGSATSRGALNATIANVMVNMPGTTGDDRFLNLCCGSGTLMVERLHSGAAEHLIGLDSSSEALRCAESNLRESGTPSDSTLLAGDARSIPLPNGSMDTIVADLPYGMLVGDSGGPSRSVRPYPSRVESSSPPTREHSNGYH